MPKGMYGFQGFRLRDAREARGMSAASLADCIQVSRQSVSQYEKGKQAPTPEVLTKIADALGFPVSRFLLPGVEQSNGVFNFRSMASATKTARTRALRRFGWLTESVELISEHIQFPQLTFPDWQFPDDPAEISMADVEDAADRLREYWGLGRGPLGNIVWLLESHGAIVARHHLLADSLDAFSVWSSTFNRPFIVLGADKESASRSRFDAAHELAHIILHRSIDGQRLTIKADFDLIEAQAHRFASAFLLPEETFSAEVFAPTLGAFLTLKHRWRVSIAAMIRRAWQIELISDETRERLVIGMSRHKWRKREPLDSELPIEEPQVLPRAIQKLVEAGVFSRSEFGDLLGLPLKDVEHALCLADGYLTSQFRELDPTEPHIVKFVRKTAQ